RFLVSGASTYTEKRRSQAMRAAVGESSPLRDARTALCARVVVRASATARTFAPTLWARSGFIRAASAETEIAQIASPVLDQTTDATHRSPAACSSSSTE